MLLRFLLLILITLGPAMADDLVLDAGSPPRTDLRSSMRFLRDPGNQLDAEAAWSAKPSFEALAPGSGLNFSYTQGAIWLRFGLRSALPETSDWRLELDYASLDHAELIDAAGRRQQSGDRLPFAARSVPHRNAVFVITLAPGETREFLLRVQSEGSLTVNPRLWRATAFAEHSENSYAAHALYFGMLLALAAYNLLLFIALRDRVFLLYVLFVLGIGVGIASIYGLAGQYLWPDAVDWSNRALVVSFALAGIVGPLFTRDFLGTALRAPGWHRGLAVGAAVHVLVLAVGLFAPMRIGMQVMSLSTMMNCVLMLGCGIACLFRQVPGARLFVLAWALLLIGGVLMALRNFGLLPTHAVTLHAMQIGSALEMLLLSFALAERFNQIKLERAAAQAEALAAQAELVASLQKHERELEQRVLERTEALAAANAQLLDMALRDPLTGLANRTALYGFLADALARAANSARPICLLLIDLDGFKSVNDRFGHEAGDRLLTEVARRLRQASRAEDLVARLGGDEFVLVAENLQLPQEAHAFAQRVLSNLSTPIDSVPDARIGASVGIAISHPGQDGTKDLLNRADAAMYQAKSKGRGTIQWS